MTYGHTATTELAFDEAVECFRALLKDEGFGVLCDIDVTKTLKDKIGADFRPYRILGVCNPAFAHQAMAQEPHLGLLLPCNVVVQVLSGKTVVSAIDAFALLCVVGNPQLYGVAEEVNLRLMRILDRMTTATLEGVTI